MATNYGKTCENENYGGMCRIYVALYRDLLWAVFIEKVPIPKLVRELEKILKNTRKLNTFHHQFKRLLDVYASTGEIKNTDCDISVIYSLFRNIPTTIDPPTHGWGILPKPIDFLVTDDLERIRHGRNTLIGHAGEASITDADFTAQLSDIKDIVRRLDGHLGSSYLPHLLRIESDCQSSKGHLNQYDEYTTELKRQQEVEAIFRDFLNEKLGAHDAKLDELDTKCDEHDIKLTAHDTKFEEQYTKLGALASQLEKHSTQYEDLEANMEEQEHIHSRVQRIQDEEEREKKERANKLAAELKHYMVDTKYKGDILPQWFKKKVVLQMFVPLQIREDLERLMTRSGTERMKERPSQASYVREIKPNSLHDIFFKYSDRQYKIFLLGEAGVGKSTFCHQLVDNWCRVQYSEPKNDIESELKLFEFLFFIQARFSEKSQTAYEMIQQQLCPLKYHKVLKKLFTKHPESCLILIDGLDEWQSGTRGYQELLNAIDIEGCTILITSRQWRVEALDYNLAPSSCRVLQIRGLDSGDINNLAEAFIRDDNPSADSKLLVKQFVKQINSLKLNSFAQIPFLLIILIKSWLNGNRNLENAHGFIFSGLIESLLVHSGKSVEYTGTRGERTNTQALPSCFNEREHCQSYSSLIHELSRLAFNMLFSDEKKIIVFRNQDLDQHPEIKEHLKLCLKLGLLTETKGLSETKECQRAFSFHQNTVQEFFSAVYLSGEGYETGYATFCERVTSPVEVLDFENVVLFLGGMNLTHCKTLFDYICNIVFARQFADRELYPAGWSMHDNIVNVQKLALLCTAEATHSLPKGSDTGESKFVIPDMVVYEDTPAHKVEQFCSLGLQIKSLVYMHEHQTTVTPYSVVKSIKTMDYIQRLGIVCRKKYTKKYIVRICKYLSNLHQLKSFSFSVAGCFRVTLPKHVSTNLVSKLCAMPNIVSVYFKKLELSDMCTCPLTSQLTSLGMSYTEALSPGVVPGWCKQLHTLYMSDFSIYPTDAHRLCQYLMTSSSLQSLTLSYSANGLSVIIDVLDLASHTSLHTLYMSNIDLKSGVRIHPGNTWRKIYMDNVSMSESMWQDFIHNLPTKPLQRLNVELLNVKSVNTQTMSYIKNKFCVTWDYRLTYRRIIHFNTIH